MAQRSVLVVDDDAAMREMLLSLLEEHGLAAQAARSAREAVERVRETEFDAVLSDIRMPERTGLELLGELRDVRPDLPVILMTAFGSIDSAVEAMRVGAFDYITKPFKRDEVMVVLERAFSQRALEEENRRLRRAVDQTSAFGDLIGRSPAMRELFALIRKIADNRSSVLITGESGTGKELIAQLVHDESTRAPGPFIAVNCGAITESLLESELFGHARGAFTGAAQDRVGLFEAANGGSLLLDEIGDVSPGMQVKLLRALQEREIRRVGENKSRPVNVRVMSATNRELVADIAAGRFRKDLYYRLNVVQLHVPPLRNRREDILPLARVLLVDAAARLKRPVTALSPRAADQLLRYDWPGNVRELENAMERAVALGHANLVELDDLPEEVRQAIPTPSVSGPVRALDEIEKDYILAVLDLNGGNQTRTAQQLGIGSATLYRKLKSYGVVRGTRGE